MEGQQGYSLPRVAILGYGNQGRAQALNYRDSGGQVIIGARAEGQGAKLAAEEGFEVFSFSEAVERAPVVFFLLPDHVIPSVYQEVLPLLVRHSPWIGFAHGFAYHYKLLEKVENCDYFLVAPKGAGAILRKRFEAGSGLPVAYAIEGTAPPELKQFVLAYAKAIGCQGEPLATTFQSETECDLFGEQAVLCGGLMEMISYAQDLLVREGHEPRLAFLEVCYEAQRILDLLLSVGPEEMTRKISPTAFYGGVTRGPRVINATSKQEMEKIFEEIRDGRFTTEWLNEVLEGMPRLTQARAQIRESGLQKAFEKVRPLISEEK